MSTISLVFWLVIVAAPLSMLVVTVFLVRLKGERVRARKLRERLECERLCGLLTRDMIAEAQGHRLAAFERAVMERSFIPMGTA